MSLWFSHNKKYAENVTFEHLNSFFLLLSSFMHHVKLKRNSRFTPKKRGPIMPSRHAPLSRHHANSVAVLQFCWQIPPWKKGQSRHHVMHHIHAITPIILLFHELCLEKMTSHAITPTAGGASYISSYFKLDSICDPYAYTV